MLLTDVIKEVWIRYRGEYHIIADPLANAKVIRNCIWQTIRISLGG